MARETNEILGHGADADGIEEYDNPLPDWWLGLFLVSIVGGIAYAIDYHFISQRSQVGYFEAEMAAAEARWPTPDGPVAFATSPELVATGEQVYTQTCASCHNAALTGGIGPNLVDDTWIHGGEPSAIVNTVTNGVKEKGMPAWGAVLGPQKVQAVVAYVVSKRGSGPPAPVDPSGPPVPVEPTEPTEPEVIDGEQIYRTNCIACHGPGLKGTVGPNLVDAEWIHGGELEQIVRTITEGVPDKGMVSWGPILGPEKIDAVARFVHSKGETP